jgi:hypothetical protein
MAPKQAESMEHGPIPEKPLRNKDGSVTALIEWATLSAATPEEILDQFLAAEIPVSTGGELTGEYALVRGEDKAAWCTAHEGQQLFVVTWRFNSANAERDWEMATMHIVARDGKFLVNDSSKGGMYGQLQTITNVREQNDPEAKSKRTSTAGLMVVNGLRRNPRFYYDEQTRKAVKADDLKKVPEGFLKESKPTWSFDL